MGINKEKESHIVLVIRLYEGCLDLTRRAMSREILQDEEALTGFIRKRGEILTRIRDIGPVTGPEVQEGGQGPKETDQAHLAVLKRIMAELFEADRELREAVDNEHVRLRGELKRLWQGQSTLKAYSPFRGDSPKFFSRRG